MWYRAYYTKILQDIKDELINKDQDKAIDSTSNVLFYLHSLYNRESNLLITAMIIKITTKHKESTITLFAPIIPI